MELQASSSHSQISASSSVYARKAWIIVFLLKSLARPASSTELAQKFRFLHLSRQFVEFLCWIPNSPLVLTDEGLVTLSTAAVVASGRFVDNLLLRVGFGGWTVPRSLRESVIRTHYRKKRGLRELVLPSLKKNKADSYLGERIAGTEVLDIGCMLTRNSFQAYDDQCTSVNCIVNVPTFSAEATAFHCGNHSDKILVDPLRLDYSLPTMRIKEKEAEIEHKTTSVDNMHEIRNVEQFKEHPFFVQPSCISSPRPDSLLLEGSWMDIFLSNVGNNAFEDQGDVEMELEMGCAVLERNINVLSSSSESIKKVASFGQDLHKESVNDSKNTTVEDVAKRKSKCTLSAYEQPFSQEYQQDVSDARPGSLFKQIEQIDALPNRRYLEGPNESPMKDNTKQIPKSNTSNQEGSGSFCINSSKNLQGKSVAKTLNYQQDILAQKIEELSEEQIDDDILRRKCWTDSNAFPIKNKTKQIPSSNISTQDKNGSFCISSPNPKDHIDSKEMPKFDLYIVEEEEGSGGYGTVYRARRKSDGVKFAIKYPHPNAYKYHIDNERKMLERFGGKDFIIKYEGSCRSENSDCFVLKHVEHDRTDVLKKDINISELQWYCYCMFTALSSLHKQGVVHRDVKPGNFLFSRKACVGYVIDFNLSKDLHTKQANIGTYPNPYNKSGGSPSKRRKIMDNKAPELASVTLKRGIKPVESKVLRNKETNHRNYKTPLAEGSREPVFYQGRKELISLAQESMQIPDHKVAGVLSNKRKRIAAAPSAGAGRKPVYSSTPMPIHSSGIAAPGLGFLKEGGKKQKEGSCSGTKGFRAPEVLLRSMHQGAKLDVWSAGVTLLYLMTGKMPFTGDPEQNMKDIVKLRGSEELWEVAKLHDRESSFPKELYDVHHLQSMELRNWCKENTKRPEFIKTIPNSLFDLVDRCLTVNPRSRISAEEVLRHEFLAPCIGRNMRKRERLLKQQES